MYLVCLFFSFVFPVCNILRIATVRENHTDNIFPGLTGNFGIGQANWERIVELNWERIVELSEKSGNLNIRGQGSL